MLSSKKEINGRYVLNSLIAPGGMGEVWDCTDKLLNRSIAIKFVHPNYIKSNPSSKKILIDEARMGAKLLGHPNIVSILDFGDFTENNNTYPFIVMEFVEGITVNEWINNSYVNDEKTYYYISLLIAYQVCIGIEYAHKKSIFHRDIKPLNIFLSNYGLTKIGDFGLARFINAATRTHTVNKAMTFAYSAPEQWKGESHTKKIDIYQLGATLYHLFTRKLPFENTDLIGLMNAHLNETPQRPNTITSIISETLSDLIMSSMEKDPSQRKPLWKLRDALADEIQGTYTIEMDCSKKSKKIKGLIYDITDFDDSLLEGGLFGYTYPDFTEALSECMQLSLLGLQDLKIQKDLVNQANEEAATTQL